MRRTWKRPELVILFRGRPEERVLENCKSPQGGFQGGPSKTNNKCDVIHGGPCGACQPEPQGGS
jgi:hypothetical protein